MNFNAMYGLQSNIYDVLKSSERIKPLVRNIYISVQKDPTYPYVLINNLEAINLSKLSYQQYEIHFDVAIFTRGRLSELNEIAARIKDEMNILSLSKNQVEVLSIQIQSTKLIKGHDLITNKLELNYKIMVNYIN